MAKIIQKFKRKKDVEKELAKEVKDLTTEIKKLKSMEFIQVFKHPWKFIWFSLLKGLMVGLGSVIGATLLVAIFIYILAKIQLVPIVGDFVESVLQEIQLSPDEITKTSLK